jgi:hypothetical protein
MKSIFAIAFFALSACGSAEQLAESLDKLSATPAPIAQPGVAWTATPLPARPSESNEALQVKLLGQWDLFSRNCQGQEFSFEFNNDGTCYMFQKYGNRYKCTWQWIENAQMKLCLGADCRTDMFISFSKDMLNIHTSKCDTEYARPEVIK